MDTVRGGTAGSPGRDTNTGHRVKTFDESMVTTYVEVMLHESLLATYVGVMIYVSTLETFEIAFKGIVFAMVYKSCIAGIAHFAPCGYEVLSSTGTDSHILRYDTEGQPEFRALRRGADEDPH